MPRIDSVDLPTVKTLRLDLEWLVKLQVLAEEKGTSVNRLLTAELQELLRPDLRDKLHDR